ncbi:hypothetical protein KOW79_021737 [Hemibagrus wyckioides]|uniref:Uncharacterized protein n=1 Tax=Hemibagrus wyckioides TaxID=337641 RepID=A0A9D3SD53_9TELE|nr:NACHT, LRR and PYD domains-containing protein 1b allele 3-like [Hemibagrus wyckioides]KAG7314434.1 hypothetical protein KOW79_021737 [Hemibagrus wyckioides]
MHSKRKSKQEQPVTFSVEVRSILNMVAENKGRPLETETRASQILEDMWRRAKKKQRRGGGFHLRDRIWDMYGMFRSADTSKFSGSRLQTHSILPSDSVLTSDFDESWSDEKNRYEFRTLYLHAGQFKCKFLDLVFDMKEEGRVMYKIVSWDRRVLERLSHMEPAGPLYNIECHKGSIHRLHLPHCETRTDVVTLSVAHVTNGNVKILQPLKVTHTHVIIEVQNLSCFGLLKASLLSAYLIRAQMRHESIRYIPTNFKCKLTPGKKYRPYCKTTDHEYVSQPEDETFDRARDPNYHPTFEVFLDTEDNKVTLSLLYKNSRVVWKPRDVMFTGTQRAATSKHSPGADFVDKYKAHVIQRVPSVMEIVDCIKSKEFTNEMYNKIRAEKTPQDKMRELYIYLNSAGRAAKAEFYQILQEKHLELVTELESGSGLD